MNTNMQPIGVNWDRQQGFEEGLAQVDDAIKLAVKKLKKEVRKEFMTRNLSRFTPVGVS